MKENNFKQAIKIQVDKERMRLLKLQEEYEKGNILEEDMEEEDINKLCKLYDEQIEELNKSTENYKRKILQIRNKLNM